ncbi:protein kinase [Streptomyces sp. NPDC091371]|uniref:protein kinase domain-containing protein n=1 Tax=Streptomyces sp. NPDC091371 TaxID=3155303 RepID=UPI0034491D8B
MKQLHACDPYSVGPYRLLSRLGPAPDTGQVYLAHSGHAHPVALTLIRQDVAARAEFRNRFREDIAAARRLGGAHTAPVVDADTEAETPWFATEYIAGPTLHQVVADDFGPLPARSLRVLARGLAYALEDVHRAGLVHHDLTPSNVLLTLDGPRLIGHRLGSEHERKPGPDPSDPARDAFALGSVLAYAATGRLPSNEPEPEPNLDDLPPELRDLVRDCLHGDPSARPALADIPARIARARDPHAPAEPWLPRPLVAGIGRHAVRLLDREDAGPDRRTAPPPRTPTPPAYTAYPTYSTYPPTEAEPPRRLLTASTALLLAVAAIVAVLSTGSVYAVLSGGEDPRPPTAPTAGP